MLKEKTVNKPLRKKLNGVWRRYQTVNQKDASDNLKIRPQMRSELSDFIQLIIKELTDNFGKNNHEAKLLVRKAGVVQSLTQNPIGFHDSPHQWALKVLTKVNDYRTLSGYYGV